MSKYFKVEDVIRKRAEDLADTSYWEYGNNMKLNLSQQITALTAEQG